jgi:hypothetical protein
LEFRLEEWEGELFRDVLMRYPYMPPAPARLSRGGGIPRQEAADRLLEESLAGQRAALKRQVTGLLEDIHAFRTDRAGWRLSLEPAKADWLIQVLNEVRVSAWVRLGSPDDLDGQRAKPPNPEMQLIEVTAYFQSFFIESLSGAAPGEEAA